jgi:hypothetical protein
MAVVKQNRPETSRPVGLIAMPGLQNLKQFQGTV